MNEITGRIGPRRLESLLDRLVRGLHGDVLDLGCGDGALLPRFKPPVEHVTAVEPDPRLRALAAEAANAASVAVEVRGGVAEHLAAPDASHDAVVSYLVLCCVDDPDAACREGLRVLRPGGVLRFLEHVRDPGLLGWLRAAGDRRFAGRRSDNCHRGRRTLEAIGRAGFVGVEHEERRFRHRRWSPLLRHVLGQAHKPAAEAAAATTQGSATERPTRHDGTTPPGAQIAPGKETQDKLEDRGLRLRQPHDPPSRVEET